MCLVYDCLYPYTVGGAERWYRNLASAFLAAGHEVTYLTRQQWPDGEDPRLDGVRVIVVSRSDDLYDESGRRRIGPPLRFGVGVLRHLLRNRSSYDVVHTCCFPYFPILSIRAALAGRAITVGVDWFEVWSDSYWRDYLGGVGGRLGALVQDACVRATPLAFVASMRHGSRLTSKRVGGSVLPIGGLYAGQEDEPWSEDRRTSSGPVVLFVGRLIPEKRADLVPWVVADLRKTHPGASGLIIGDGPGRTAVEQAIVDAGVVGAVETVGFIKAEGVRAAMGSATCLLAPSAREGYGLVIIEAAVHGTPSVVVEGPDNAAVELIEDGVNGAVAVAGDPRTIAEMVAAVIDGGAELRRSTRHWFELNASRLRIDRSSAAVVGEYERRSDRQQIRLGPAPQL